VKRFSFKLTPLLDQRKRKEEQAQRNLAKASVSLQLMEDEKIKLENDLSSMKDSLAPLNRKNSSGEEYMNIVWYSTHLRYRIKNQGEKIEKQIKLVEDLRKILLKKTQEKRALEILRDKEFEEWKKEQKITETKLLDDFSQQQSFRQKAKQLSLLLFLVCLVAMPGVVQAGSYQTDFNNDLGDTSNISSSLFPSTLQLAIDSIYFEEDLDTTLTHNLLWNTSASAGNAYGAYPQVQSRKSEKDFYVSYLSLIDTNTVSTIASANLYLQMDVSLVNNDLILKDTIAANLHKDGFGSGLAYRDFFFLGLTSTPVPSQPEYIADDDEYLMQWTAEFYQGRAPILRTTSMYQNGGLLPESNDEFRGKPLTWVDGPVFSPAPDTVFVTTRSGVLASSALSPWKGDMKKAVSAFGPLCLDGNQFSCDNSDAAYIRWEDMLTRSIIYTDSVVPVTPALSGQSYYNLAVASDTSGDVIFGWTEGNLGTDLFVQAWDASPAKSGVPVQVQTGLDTRTTESTWRNWDLDVLRENEFIAVYARGQRIYMRRIQTGAGGAVPLSEVAVSIPGADCFNPAVDVGANHMVVSFFRENASGRTAEVVRFERSGTTFGDTLVRRASTNVTFSSTAATSRSYLHNYSIVSAAADTSGNILAGYNLEGEAWLTSWTNQAEFHSPGTFYSDALDLVAPGVSASIIAGDSVQFLSMYSRGSLDSTQTSLEFSTNSGFAPVTGMGTQDSITTYTPKTAADFFFRYKVELWSSADRRYTPRVDSVGLTWNIKPRAPQITGVTVGDATQLTVPWFADSTYEVFARYDTVFLDVRAIDLDDPASLRLEARIDDTLLLYNDLNPVETILSRDSAGHYSGQIIIPPFNDVSAGFSISLHTEDESWKSAGTLTQFGARNSPPQTEYHLSYEDGEGTLLDTLVGESDLYLVQVTDTPVLRAIVADYNDSIYNAHWQIRNSSGVRWSDSALFQSPRDTLEIPLYPPTTDLVAIDTVEVSISDADTSVSFIFYLAPNHPPRIDSVDVVGYLDGSVFIPELTDRIRDIPNDELLTARPTATNFVYAHISDPDSVFGDTLSYEWHVLYPNLSTGVCCVDTLGSFSDTLSWVFPVDPPHKIEITVRDQTRKAVVDTFLITFPFLDTAGSQLDSIRNVLQDSLDFVLGQGETTDTVSFTLKSNGVTPLRIEGMATDLEDELWFNYLAFWSGNQSLLIESNTDSSRISASNAIVLTNSEEIEFKLIFDISSMSGDSVLLDSLRIFTNDFFYPELTLPLRLEYNDLPEISVFTIPNHPGTYTPSDSIVPLFPFYSSLVFAFSEPVDSTNITNHIQVYSYYDSLARGITGVTPIDPYYNSVYRASRNSANTRQARYIDTLIFTPNYRTPSDHFNVQPPPLSFVHSDIIHIWISNAISDYAGNPLDVHRNSIPLSSGTADTLIIAPVDTSLLRVMNTVPDSGETLNPDEPIQILFNNPLAPRAIFGTDTIPSLDLATMAGDSNFMISMRTAQSRWEPVDFRSIELINNDSGLSVRPLRKFYALDTVRVRIAPTVYDILGHSLDGNEDRVFTWPADSNDYFEFEFTVGESGFYVYPNPFKFFNPEHTDKGTISFKNLHQISGARPDKALTIRIYTFDGLLVHSSRRLKSSVTLSSEGQVPEWEWNLKNNHGRTVASGVYLYLIGHDHKVLEKGKVMVIH